MTRIPNQIGLTIRVPGKIVFLVPWPDHWLIGTTDAAVRGLLRPPGGGRLGDRQAARHGQRDDGRRPAPRATWSARTRGCGRSSPRRAARRSRRRASTASRSSRTASCASAAASTRPTGSWRATRSTRSSGKAAAPARPSQTAERRLVGAADPEALDRIVAELATIPAVGAVSADAGRPARRPPRDRGARRRRARRGAATSSARSSPAARSSRPR